MNMKMARRERKEFDGIVKLPFMKINLQNNDVFLAKDGQN